MPADVSSSWYCQPERCSPPLYSPADADDGGQAGSGQRAVTTAELEPEVETRKHQTAMAALIAYIEHCIARSIEPWM
jgi:hypothetical protein